MAFKLKICVFALMAALGYVAGASIQGGPSFSPPNECLARCPLSTAYIPICLVVNGKYEEFTSPSITHCYDNCGLSYLLYDYGKCPPTDQQDAQKCLDKCPLTFDFNKVCISVNGSKRSENARTVSHCYDACGINYTKVSEGQCA